MLASYHLYSICENASKLPDSLTHIAAFAGKKWKKRVKNSYFQVNKSSLNL